METLFSSGSSSSSSFAVSLFPAELSLACVLRAADIQREPGDAVRDLAHRLGIRRTRFRPLLPLGRAADWDEPPTSEALGAHADPMELIEGGFHPVASCGLGQNLYVEPSGQSFPCYAYHQPHSHLGNVLRQGLRPILESESFRDLSCHTVDTNPKCHGCDLRYLCGGACGAWGGGAAQSDLNAPHRVRPLRGAYRANLARQEPRRRQLRWPSKDEALWEPFQSHQGHVCGGCTSDTQEARQAARANRRDRAGLAHPSVR